MNIKELDNWIIRLEEYIENNKSDLILNPFEANEILLLLEEFREQHKNY